MSLKDATAAENVIVIVISFGLVLQGVNSHWRVNRNLLITYLSLQLAQSIGVDHHAAKELYYYMLTKDNETHTMLTEFMDHFYERVCKDKDEASPNR